MCGIHFEVFKSMQYFPIENRSIGFLIFEHKQTVHSVETKRILHGMRFRVFVFLFASSSSSFCSFTQSTQRLYYFFDFFFSLHLFILSIFGNHTMLTFIYRVSVNSVGFMVDFVFYIVIFFPQNSISCKPNKMISNKSHHK